MKFTAGNTYTQRSICDSNCVFSFRVVSRTAKTMQLDSGDGVTRRVGIKFDREGCEFAFPLGRYSMAPTIRAN
jgi:hypothetical protein